MKFEIRFRKDAQTRGHQVELKADAVSKHVAGQRQFIIDGTPVDADCAQTALGTFSILIDGRSYEARVQQAGDADGASSNEWLVTIGEYNFCFEVVDPRVRRHASKIPSHDGPLDIAAPMPGKVVKVLTAEDQDVTANQGLVVIEAMKMQNELRAPRPGRVAAIYVSEGMGIEAGAKLLRLE